jgi:hypothetical protein
MLKTIVEPSTNKILFIADRHNCRLKSSLLAASIVTADAQKCSNVLVIETGDKTLDGETVAGL